VRRKGHACQTIAAIEAGDGDRGPQNVDAETVRLCRAIGGRGRAWVAEQSTDDEAETVRA